MGGIDLHSLYQDPRLRLFDVPGMDSLVACLQLDPENPHLLSLFSEQLQVQARKAQLAEQADCFYPNLPPKSHFPRSLAGRIPFSLLPIGDVNSIDAHSDTRQNVLIIGYTGSGKTALLRIILLAAIEAGVSVILFDAKGDALHSSAFANPQLPIISLNARDLKLALLEPPKGIDLRMWTNQLLQVIAGQHLSLQASKRLLIDSLWRLFHSIDKPRLSDFIKVIDAIKPRSFSSESHYKETSLYALKSILWAFGESLDYSSSTMISQVLHGGGCCVIRTDGLSNEMASLLAGVLINYAYLERSLDGASKNTLLFVLDDAMPLVAQKQGEISPLAQWAFMGRSRGLGFVVSAQLFREISTVLRDNTSTIAVCGARGDDAVAIGRHLSLTNEQIRRLTTLRPGEVVTMSFNNWPKALYGRVPYLG